MTQPQPQPTSAPQTESGAIVSLVLGVAGLIAMPVILSIPAIIVGKSAERRIAASGGTLTGAELAKAGIICGWIGIGLAALALVIGFFVLILVAGLASVS